MPFWVFFLIWIGFWSFSMFTCSKILGQKMGPGGWLFEHPITIICGMFLFVGSSALLVIGAIKALFFN
jgi:hypothetical protein